MINEYTVKGLKFSDLGDVEKNAHAITSVLNQAAASKWRLEHLFETKQASTPDMCVYLVFRNMGNASPID